MKAIMVMYDSLNRRLLEPYGCDWTKTPNFARLAERTMRFDNCYVGSMPCMPARRDLHTGRLNFLHRSWGPLEPFDDSMPEILKENGICTHLISDHQHYWEDGGATYHTRYSSWECIRGQEGDPWKENLNLVPDRRSVFKSGEWMWRFPLGAALKTHDQVNRTYMDTEEKTAHVRTLKEGLEFLETNHTADNWFLHLEYFDPHEPFYCDEKYKKDFDGPLHGEDAIGADWPPYAPVEEREGVIQTVRNGYAALLEKCDTYLGEILDRMDQYDLWKDTMLIVCTDHGFLLGEHNWWGKSAMPYWNEIANTPLFVYDPRFDCAGKTSDALVQMMDLSATLLEYFNTEIPADMMGRPLRPVMEEGKTIHDSLIFGCHGDDINITDGRYVYMNAPENKEEPSYDYTLMPTHMRSRFSVDELKDFELAEPFSFTKGLKTMKIRCAGSFTGGGTLTNESRLYDLRNDPQQLQEIHDEEIEQHMKELLSEWLQKADAPQEVYARYNIPLKK